MPNQDTIYAAAIPRRILWVSRSFFSRYSVGDGYWVIGVTISVMPSGTLLEFYPPLCLILSPRVSIDAFLAVTNNWLHTYPPSRLSSQISYDVPIVLSLCLSSAAAVLISLCPNRRIFCHSCPPYLSYRVPDSAIIINIILSFIFHLWLSPSSHISASTILTILHLCRV